MYSLRSWRYGACEIKIWRLPILLAALPLACRLRRITSFRLRLQYRQLRRLRYVILSFFLCFSYHHFKIKAPTGTSLVICSETNEHDPFALACHIPNEMDQIPESLRTVEMSSKSQKKKYTLREVLGSQIGRVQYFLNRLGSSVSCSTAARLPVSKGMLISKQLGYFVP